MEYEIQVGDFQGPLDLLYKLVKKRKIEISEISLAKITGEYLEYLDHLQGFNLDLASEFMVIASELIEMKARLILPGNSENEEQEDSNDLVQRLEEYKKFKSITQILMQYEEIAANCYKRPVDDIGVDNKILEIDSDPQDLAEIYLKAITSEENEDKNESISISEIDSINPERISLDQKQEEIRYHINQRKQTSSFKDLLEDESDILEIVVTLLGLLELMRAREITVIQDDLFNEIIVKPGRAGDRVECG